MSLMEKIRAVNFAVLIRFGLSSLGTLVVKVLITGLFSHGINEYLSYFLTHCIILFWSYNSHLRFTFKAAHSMSRFWAYTRAVFFIKVLDFILFGLFFTVSTDQLTLSVLLASGIVSVIRFFSVRKALTDIATEPDSNSVSSS